MSSEILVEGKEGEKQFLLANEAIVRGLIEAGVGLAATYPGTPSSEVGDTLSKIANRAEMYFEYSTNESVAMEVAAAAAASGVRSFVFMKHVGLNVASDPMMSTVYTGTRAGFVIMSADDPSMHSSQNEQDNRHYSKLSHMPMIEPSTPQEAKDFVVEAFEISEKLRLPVLFRTTTRVSHLRGIVEFGNIKKTAKKSRFEHDQSLLVPLPGNAYKMRDKLEQKYNAVKEFAETSNLNKIEMYGESEIGIISSGAAYNSLRDVIIEHDLKVKVLKLGFTNPFPEKLVYEFMKDLKKVIVVEELDPFLESETRLTAQLHNMGIEIYGKINDYFPKCYEYNVDIVYSSLAKILNLPVPEKTDKIAEVQIPNRPPVLCPGCPHRATFYATKLALRQLRMDDAIVPSDIGCYSLGIEKPYVLADYVLAMGSSVGTSGGFAKVTDQPIIAFIGDSTFFHAGIPGLINAVHNKHKFVLVILDNRTTAMTGHQPNPGVPLDAMQNPAPQINVEDVVKAAGVGFVKTVDPYDLRATIKVLREALSYPKVAVVVAKQECALLIDAKKRKENVWTTYMINQDKCTQCMNCVTKFSCPAIYLQDSKVYIASMLCDGCGICAQPQVCGFNAIEVSK